MIVLLAIDFERSLIRCVQLLLDPLVINDSLLDWLIVGSVSSNFSDALIHWLSVGLLVHGSMGSFSHLCVDSFTSLHLHLSNPLPTC